MEKDIVSIIKYKWEQNQSIEIGDLMLGDEDQLEKELHKYEYLFFNDSKILIHKIEYFILMEIYYNKLKSISIKYLKKLLELKDDEIMKYINHLIDNDIVISKDGLLKGHFYKFAEHFVNSFKEELDNKKIQLNMKEMEKFETIEIKIEEMESKIEDYEMKLKGIEKEAYRNIISLMGVFIAIFSLISVNFSLFEKASNFGMINLFFFSSVINVSLIIVILALFYLIKKFFMK